MKFLLFLFISCSAIAKVPRSEKYPPSFFSTREEAITSVKNASAGGSFQELDAGEKKVLVLYHYASGAFSSDAAIYVQDGAAWRLLAYYAPVFNDSIEASSKESSVVLKTSQKKLLLLTVSVNPEK